MSKGLKLCLGFCIASFALLGMLSSQTTFSMGEIGANGAIVGQHYIKFNSLAERDKFETLAISLPVSLPVSNNTFKRANYAMLRVENVVDIGLIK